MGRKLIDNGNKKTGYPFWLPVSVRNIDNVFVDF